MPLERLLTSVRDVRSRNKLGELRKKTYKNVEVFFRERLKTLVDLDLLAVVAADEEK